MDRESVAARELDLLLVPRRPYQDLLALIAGRAPTPSSLRDPDDSHTLVDWLLECWQILPSLSASLFEQTFKEILQKNDYLRLCNCWLAVSSFAKAQFVGCLPLIQAFERSGVSYSLLKGAATGFRLYPHSPYLRASSDIDLGVARWHLETAKDLARQAGFHPAQINPRTNRFDPADPNLRAAVEAQHYELGFLVRRLQVTNLPTDTLEAIRAEPWTHQLWRDVNDGTPWCYAIVDIHHALSLDIDLDDLLSTTHIVRSTGSSVRIPDDSWLAAHLVFKIYWEGVHNAGKGLYQFSDIVRLVPLMDALTFGSFIAILERYNLIAAGHYVLRRLPAFGIELPEHVLSFIQGTFRPPAGGNPIRLNDLGDMWARLWGQR